MRKVLLALLYGVSLIGCVRSADEYLSKETEKPIVSTMEMYKKYNDGSYGACSKVPDRGGFEDYEYLTGMELGWWFGAPIWMALIESFMYDYQTLADPDAPLHRLCTHSKSDCGDRYSKVCFFNYTKYLPQDSNVETDDDFLWLAEKYQGLKDGGMADEQIEQALRDTMNGELATKLATRKAKEAKERQEKQKKAAQAKAEQQRKAKEEEKKRQEKKAKYQQCRNGLNLCDGFVKGCRYSLHGEVTSIMRNGVLVFDRVYRFFMPTNEGDVYFLYTDKDYASGSYINGQIYYEYVGKYKYTSTDGDKRRVHAFKETDILRTVCDKYK